MSHREHHLPPAKEGDVRVFKGVKVRFGMSGGFKHDEDVKRFATSEGAGLWARAYPNSPTVEQDTIAWLKRYEANPNNRRGQPGTTGRSLTSVTGETTRASRACDVSCEQSRRSDSQAV
jgi:hypothetical protein